MGGAFAEAQNSTHDQLGPPLRGNGSHARQHFLRVGGKLHAEGEKLILAFEEVVDHGGIDPCCPRGYSRNQDLSLKLLVNCGRCHLGSI